MLRRHPRPTLVPYTTLFRSRGDFGRPFEDSEVEAESVVGREECGEEQNDLQVKPGRAVAVAAGGEGDDLVLGEEPRQRRQDLKSTRLNSSHANISYAVFSLK